MDLRIVVMPGASWVEFPLLRAAAQCHGWAVEVANNLNELLELRKHGVVGAVLFEQDSLDPGSSWAEAIPQLKEVVPEAHLVACCHFSDSVDYPKLCRAGLFHALWLPLKASEVRQCLSFVWEAEKQMMVLERRSKMHLTRAAS
jgi:DNA-binding NtrC family response regulator